MDCAINVSAARNPVLLSLPRPDVPLHSMTLLELLHQMDEQGWECRRRLGDVSVEPYRLEAEAPKIWHIKDSVSRCYLQCLLQAADLHAVGVLAIPHDERASYYTQFFKKDGSVTLPEAVQTDLEFGHLMISDGGGSVFPVLGEPVAAVTGIGGFESSTSRMMQAIEFDVMPPES